MNKFLIDQEFFDEKLKEWNNIYLDELLLLNLDINSISSNPKQLDNIFKELAKWKYDPFPATYSDNYDINKLQFMRQLKEIVYIDSKENKISNTKVHDFLAGLKKGRKENDSSRIQKIINTWQLMPTQPKEGRLCSKIFDDEKNKIYLNGITIEIEKRKNTNYYNFRIRYPRDNKNHILFARNPYISDSWSDEELKYLYNTYLHFNKHHDEYLLENVANDIFMGNLFPIKYLFCNISNILNSYKRNDANTKIFGHLDERIISLIHNTYIKNNDDESKDFPNEDIGNDYPEGAVKRIIVNKYERDIEARKKCIDYHGYKCSICGFDFHNVYGELGNNFIHVHHKIPLSKIKEIYNNKEYKLDPKNDLIPICPNCHAMIHKLDSIGDEAVEKLKSFIKRISLNKN